MSTENNKSDEMSFIVKYRNELNQWWPNMLTERENRIYAAIITQVKEKGTDEINISYTEFRSLIGLSDSNTSYKEIIDTVEELWDEKLQRSYYKAKDDKGHFLAFNLFRYLRCGNDNIQIRVTEEFAYLINNIPEKAGFTKFLMDEFGGISGKYAQDLYRHLRQFEGSDENRGSQYYILKVKDIPRLFGVKDDCPTKYINYRIIMPAVKELRKLSKFKSLKVFCAKEGHSIASYAFVWSSRGESKVNREIYKYSMSE